MTEYALAVLTFYFPGLTVKQKTRKEARDERTFYIPDPAGTD